MGVAPFQETSISDWELPISETNQPTSRKAKRPGSRDGCAPMDHWASGACKNGWPEGQCDGVVGDGLLLVPRFWRESLAIKTSNDLNILKSFIILYKLLNFLLLLLMSANKIHLEMEFPIEKNVLPCLIESWYHRFVAKYPRCIIL